MKSHTGLAGVLGVVLGLTSLSIGPAQAQSAAPSAAACDRACLTHVLDTYFSALLAHDPSRLPQTADVRFTENNVPLEMGEALWRTASGTGQHDVVFAEPSKGEVGTIGLLEESGRPVLFAARLKIVRGKVSELETVVVRKETATFMEPSGWNSAAPLMMSDLAPAEQTPRAQMVSVVNKYFDTLKAGDGDTPPFDPDCNRLENGVRTTNNPDAFPKQKDGPLGAAITGQSCEAQFKLGMGAFITHIRDRRYTVADQRKGLVLVSSFFDHAGDVKAVTLKNGQTFHLLSPMDTPYSFVLNELFKIRSGRILEIQALIMPVPYGTKGVWMDPKYFR